MEGKFAPYAPPAAVLNVIRHYTQRDVPERISPTNLIQIGVTESLVPRTIAALRFLDLLREDQTTTDLFRALRYAGQDDYHEVLGRMLDAAYKDVFDHIDVTTASERDINNAFIPYSPGGQRGRMITLFLALCREAGWEVAASASAKPIAPRVPRPRKDAKPAIKTTRSGPTERNAEPPDANRRVTADPGFTVTDADFAALPESEFDTVWSALGLIAKARARAAREQAATQTEGSGGN